MKPSLPKLLVLALWLPALHWAQTAEPAAPDKAKPAAGALQFSSDLGGRFLAGQHGSTNTYRSLVNLGEGLRLLQFQANYQKPGRYLDEFRLTGTNWGDPLSTVMLQAGQAAHYRLQASYRNLAYFNALPSFASPGLNGFAGSQRTFDTRQRIWNVDLDLRPGKSWQPFFGLAGNTNLGTGITPFVLDENSYPAATWIDNRYQQFRGGLRVEKENLHLTLEQGGAVFADDNRVANNVANLGNRGGLYLGRQLLLRDAQQLYAVNGNHLYSTASLSVSPATWLDLTGDFYYSRPRSTVQFNETAQGTLFWLESYRFVNGQQSLATGYANQPRTSGGFTATLQPQARFRFTNSLLLDRTHNAGSLALVTTLDSRALPTVNLQDRLVWNQQENRLQLFYDLAKSLTLFGGHRYLWGDAQVRRASLATGPSLEAGLLSRHSGLGGFVYRPSTKLTLHGDSEVGRGDQTWFRTSLQNFEQWKLRARWQLHPQWQWQARFGRLHNSNPNRLIGLEFTTQQANLTLQWTGKRASVMADYTRSAIATDLGYRNPVFYNLIPTNYRDRAHSGTLAADFTLPRKLYLTVGGSLFRNGGSRPSRYYQPLIRLRLPLQQHAGLLAEWRHVSFGQTLFPVESFGVQQFTFGLHLQR